MVNFEGMLEERPSDPERWRRSGSGPDPGRLRLPSAQARSDSSQNQVIQDMPLWLNLEHKISRPAETHVELQPNENRPLVHCVMPFVIEFFLSSISLAGEIQRRIAAERT